MKKIFYYIVFALFISLPMIASAQESPMDKLFDKYSGEEGFTSVNISSQMFKLLAKIDSEDDEEIKDFNNVVSELTGMRILSYTEDDGAGKKSEFYDEIIKNLPKKVYSELMVVKEKGKDVTFYIRELENGKIGELLMIVNEDHNTVLLSFKGMIDLDNISIVSFSDKVHLPPKKGMLPWKKTNLQLVKWRRSLKICGPISKKCRKFYPT